MTAHIATVQNRDNRVISQNLNKHQQGRIVIPLHTAIWQILCDSAVCTSKRPKMISEFTKQKIPPCLGSDDQTEKKKNAKIRLVKHSSHFKCSHQSLIWRFGPTYVYRKFCCCCWFPHFSIIFPLDTCEECRVAVFSWSGFTRRTQQMHIGNRFVIRVSKQAMVRREWLRWERALWWRALQKVETGLC